MAQWIAGKVLTVKRSSDRKLQKLATNIHVAWVIARHGSTIYFKMIMKNKKESIAYCAEEKMDTYFTIDHLHEKMPLVSGSFDDAKLFPTGF